MARRVGRCVGAGLNAIDQLLDAGAEADIQLAEFVEDELTIVFGVQLALADFEDAVLALAERQQLQRGGLEGCIAAVVGQHAVWCDRNGRAGRAARVPARS